MKTPETMGRGLATSAQLALVAILSLALSTNTHNSSANTLPSKKIKVRVADPAPADIAAARAATRLDRAMNALSLKDAAAYRAVFEAQEQGAWDKADTLIAEITDQRLLGYIWADRYERKGAASGELVSWLKTYGNLPEAGTIYALAAKAGLRNLPHPSANETWAAGNEIDSAANFSADLMVNTTADGSDTNKLARSIRAALRRNDPWKARDLLIPALNEKKAIGSFAADAEAVIAASLFYAGERDQAAALSTAAAGANQPLGMWINGLIAWENKEYGLARSSFTKLAEHPALNESNRAAAHFWAYRAESRSGNRALAMKHLDQASLYPRSFYGMLAGQLMGRNPMAALEPNQVQSKWDATNREILVGHPAGWRALALVQIGQNARAEAELRRLNPQGDADRIQAMQALASFVPMPALSVQLATLGDTRDIAAALYPLPPWKPAEGFQVDRALLYALARHESLFDPQAVSNRGARGLMQIMPSTAAHVITAGASNKMSAALGNLLDPDFNMALGQKYVQRLAEIPQIGNNLILLLSAYNAGPAKAINWASRKENPDALLFLESIPVRETRNYVARVLPHYWAYSTRLGTPSATLRQMAEGKWPTVTLGSKADVRFAQVSVH